MTRNETYYRKVIGAIGATMLLFWGLITAFSIVIAVLPIFLAFVPEPVATVVYQTVYAAIYLLSFMMPVLLLKHLIKRAGYVYQPMRSEFQLSPWIFLLVPAVVAVNFSAAYFNSAMVNIFDYSAFSSEILWGQSMVAPPVYAWVLEFMVMCVVPGFCEEFLFRGAILNNCRPFGRTNAILISALLFSLMHQNAEQIFYAFIAGIFLGIIYEKTGNIWCGTVIHIFNNFLSTFEGVLFYKSGDWFTSSVIITVFEVLLLLLGGICLAILIGRFFSRKERFEEGVFEKNLPATDEYASHPISAKRAVQLFMRPTMVIFLVLCVIQIVSLILLALGYQYVYGV